jgi:putative ABC transport system permease protein
MRRGGAERAERRYRKLLRLLPARVRSEGEAELLEVFRDAYTRRRGSRVGFWMRMLVDLLVTAMAERMSGQRAPDGGRRSGVGAVMLDLTVAVRRLGREPGQAAVSAFALGVGLAATVLAAVLVRDVLLTPLPFAEPDRLVRLLERDSTGGGWYPSYPNIRDWREQATFLDGVVATDVPQDRTVLFDGSAVRTSVGAVSRGFFELLGVRPVVGRTFAPEEDVAGGPPVALVSREFWRSVLGERALAGIALTIGTETYAVIGVLPSGFRFLAEPGAWRNASIWLPLERNELGGRQSHGYHTVARLREGVTLEAAAAGMTRLSAALKAQHGEPTQADDVRVTALSDEVVGAARQPLRLLLGAAVFVLLVTCFNLAGAVLARGLARSRELSIRVSLGARRRDLIRHVVIETGALAVPGAAIGILLAAAGLRAVQSMGLSVPRLDEVRLDAVGVGLTVLLAVVVAVGAGLVPALALPVRDLAARLRTQGPPTHTREQRHLWHGFVAVQVALTLVLLAGTGLLVRSLREVVTRDIGYEPGGLLAVDVSLPELHYADDARRVRYYTEALERVRRLPGVQAAGLTNVLPHETTARTSSTRSVRSDTLFVFGGLRVVDPGYFAALGITQLAGAGFDAGVARQHAAVIDTTLVRQLWRDRSPLGDGVRNYYVGDTLTVIGTVASIREWNYRPVGVVYVDYRARPAFLLDMHFIVRPATPQVAAAVRGALEAIDPLVPVTVEGLETRIAQTYGERRLLLLIAACFAAVALLLAALGVYAVVAYAVARELKAAAIRITLGARRGAVIGRLIVRGLRPVLTGLLAGAVAAVPAFAALRSQLFGVQPFDPLSLAGGVVALTAIAVLAAYLPARTAGRVDPIVILRPD